MHIQRSCVFVDLNRVFFLISSRPKESLVTNINRSAYVKRKQNKLQNVSKLSKMPVQIALLCRKGKQKKNKN